MPTFLLSFLSPRVLAGIALAAAGAGVSWYAHHGYAKAADIQSQFDAYKRVVKTQEADAERKLLAAEQVQREKEQSWQAKFAAIDAQHQEQMKNVEIEHQKIVAALQSGAVRVRDNRAAVCASVPAGQTSPNSSGDNGASTSQLSAEGTDFLLRLGTEADQVVTQLQACQDLLQSERQ